MPPRRDEPLSPSQTPSDDFLISSLLGGDETALRKLIDRYDRLVRFTIYRSSKAQCAADPQWLDSVASSAWAGFLQTLRRRSADCPRSTAALLATIARNHAVSALRTRMGQPLATDDAQALASFPATLDDASVLLAEVELLAALRDCSATLDEPDRLILSQSSLLLERRWRDAAAALAVSESTLRYRWTRVLERLRDCVEGKTGREFAPQDRPSDS